MERHGFATGLGAVQLARAVRVEVLPRLFFATKLERPRNRNRFVAHVVLFAIDCWKCFKGLVSLSMCLEIDHKMGST